MQRQAIAAVLLMTLSISARASKFDDSWLDDYDLVLRMVSAGRTQAA